MVAHGFFNTMIGIELRRMGWRCVKGRGYRYWSTRCFGAVKRPVPQRRCVRPPLAYGGSNSPEGR